MSWVLIEPIEGGVQRREMRSHFLAWSKVHKKEPLPEDQRSNGIHVYHIIAEAEEKRDLPRPTVAAPARVRSIPAPVLPSRLQKDVVVASVPPLPEAPELDPAGEPVSPQAVDPKPVKNKGGRSKKNA